VTTFKDMADLNARLAVLDKIKSASTELAAETGLPNPLSLLAHPLVRWRFRQNRQDWEEFAAALRDPDDGFFKEECPPSFSIENREQLAAAIEAALAGIDHDGEAGTS
jgi:hypothetical protein